MNASDYPQLQALFDRQLVTLTPAEAHGLLAALLSGGGTEPELWLENLFGSTDAARGLDADEGALLARVFGATQRDLDGSEFEFELLLPDDDQPLPVRVEALSTWCQGFLYGLGLRGLADSPALSADARELIADLTSIGRADVEADDDGGDAEEAAYAEIVQYVKVGVLSLHEDLRPLRDAVDADETLH